MIYIFILNRKPTDDEKVRLIRESYYQLRIRGIEPKRIWVEDNILYVETGEEVSAQLIGMLVAGAIAIAVATIGLSVVSWKTSESLGTAFEWLKGALPGLVLTAFGLAFVFVAVKLLSK